VNSSVLFTTIGENSWNGIVSSQL